MKTNQIPLKDEAWMPNPKKNWKIGYNRSIESFDPSKLDLHTEHEHQGGAIKGKVLEVLAERMKETGLNSNVLRYLLDHPEIIPGKWKEKTGGKTTRIYFFGTILLTQREVVSQGGEPCVLYLSWDGTDDSEEGWDWHVSYLGEELQGDPSAAILS